MANGEMCVGIIGGAGMLGSAIAEALLARSAVAPGRLWISSRSGRAPGVSGWPEVTVTADNGALVEACDAVLLCVPPAQADVVGIRVPEKLVISVMAGITVARLQVLTSAGRVIRAMSSPAARNGLAYSPFFAGPAVSEADRALARRLFGACGTTDEVEDEVQIDVFTAITGPVPGFVAYFADCVATYAETQGVDPQIADRAVRQLFLAAGTMLAEGRPTAAGHVREMIDYAGTTAAGLRKMEGSPLRRAVHEGLEAARLAAQKISSSAR